MAPAPVTHPAPVTRCALVLTQPPCHPNLNLIAQPTRTVVPILVVTLTRDQRRLSLHHLATFPGLCPIRILICIPIPIPIPIPVLQALKVGGGFNDEMELELAFGDPDLSLPLSARLATPTATYPRLTTSPSRIITITQFFWHCP